jgi:molecular chaperone GrpE
MVEENDSVEDNTILNELQKGYIFKDRLLRPAMVVVSRRPVSTPENV